MGRLVRSAALAADLAFGLAAASAAGSEEPGLAASAVHHGRVGAALTGAGGAGAVAGRRRSLLVVNGDRLVAAPAIGSVLGIAPGAGGGYPGRAMPGLELGAGARP
jgi:hypothetical protein